MIIRTTFDMGDAVFVVINDKILGPLTVAMVRVLYIDSPGREGEELFDNYKAQKRHEEEYMCVETGVGTGSVYRVDQLHRNRVSAEAAALLNAQK